MVNARRALSVALAATVLAAAALCLFLPVPAASGAGGETYLCEWADGSVTRESYASAFADYNRLSGEGNAVLSRGGRTGEISFGEDFVRIYGVLQGGSLAEMLALNAEALPRLERAVLYRALSGKLFYDGGFFIWDGYAMARTGVRQAEELVLLSGGLPSNALSAVRAVRLTLRAGAEIGADDFIGSLVTEITAQPPYEFADGLLYLIEAGSKRLVAGLPRLKGAAVFADTDFIDEGAFAPCTALEEITLPFLGNARDCSGERFVGELGYLFARDGMGRYAVPSTLARVKVTGGTILSRAFYLCANVREVDACGVPAGRIAPDAFAGMDGLEILHTLRLDAMLTGAFKRTTAPCGCAVYVREK